MVPHLHNMVSLQLLFKCFTRSDFKSGLHFALAAMGQKIADRWGYLLSLWAASPMGVGLIGFDLHIVARIMSFVMALHAHYLLSYLSQNKGSGLTPYTNVSSWWSIQIIFIEVKSLCSPWIRSLDLWSQGSIPYQSRHGGCKDLPAKA